MKKFIAAVALSLAFCLPASAAMFGHWASDANGISVFAKLENGAGVGLIVNRDASVVIGIDPKNSDDMGKEIHVESGEFYVDDQPIKGTIRWHEQGGILITPDTLKGNNFITGKLWTQQRVTIKYKEFEFWVTAKGVQKAWRHSQSIKQAI